MTQSYTKDELHREMRRIHDEIKKHPVRVGFETQYIPEYKHLLYELSRKWSDLIWRCSELTDEESRLYRQFGGWIHDYRQELRTYHKDTFPMDLFPSKDFIVLTRITQLRRVCRSGEKATIELGYRLCTDATTSVLTV